MSKRSSDSDSQDGQTSKKAKPSSDYEAENICESYNDNDADITLISSDDVVFKVHSYRLMAASPVFHTMFALGSNVDSPIIDLTDEDIEYSRVIILFLDLIYGRSLTAPKEWDQFESCINLASFLAKYEAKPAISHYETILRLWAAHRACSGDFLLVAGERLKNPLLARLLIEKAGTIKISTATTLMGPINGASSLDISAWSYNAFHEVSDSWKFALLRATRTEDSGTTKRDWKAIGEKFEQVLKEVEKEYGSE